MNKDELYKLFSECKNVTGVLKKLNFSDHQKNRIKVKDLMISCGFDINLYNKPKKYCLRCNKELKKNQNKYCSSSCSAINNNIGRTVSVKTKEKIKESINKYLLLNKEKNYTQKLKKEKSEIIKIDTPNHCIICNVIINKRNKYCSNSCIGKHKHYKNYENFIKNPNDFNRGNYSPKSFKDFFLIEQNNKCLICGNSNKWNDKEIVFVLDHIDGDASNNKRENLRLVCPNCDSQLDTFKSKNKNSKRRNYFREKILNDYKKQNNIQD